MVLSVDEAKQEAQMQPLLVVRDVLNARYTCRDFRSDPVPRTIIDKILEAATRAPSTANTQPWEIFVAGGDRLSRIREHFLLNHDKNRPPHPDLPMARQWPAALKKRVDEIMALHQKELMTHPGEVSEDKKHQARNFQFFGAPVVIYLCMDKSLGFWSIFDLGLLTQSILLEAREWGLDTAPALMLVAYPDIIREELAIPNHLSVVFGIALGYAAEGSRPGEFKSPRRPLSEVVHYSGFGT